MVKYFSAFASKIFENGYSIIPIHPASKYPIESEWSRFCSFRAEPDLVDEWCEKYPSASISVACGHTVVAVDIDLEDDFILSIIPPSIVARRGKAGRQTRFFRYNEAIGNKQFPGWHPVEKKNSDLVSILSTGRHCVVIGKHPSGGEYHWLTPDTLMNISPDELPELDVSFYDALSIHIRSKYPNKDKKGNDVLATISGRNNRYSSIVSSMVSRGESFETVCREIYTTDLDEEKRLFIDKKEGFPAKDENDAIRNVNRFVASHWVSLARIPANKFFAPGFNIQDMGLVKIKDDDEPKPYTPFAHGNVIDDFIKLCRDETGLENEWLFFSAAIAMVSGIAAHRFKTEFHPYTVTPNIYILSIAESGAGKDYPQNKVKEMLDDQTIIGASAYKSGRALLEHIQVQQAILWISDEAQQVYSSQNKKEDWNSELSAIILSIYTQANGVYDGSLASSYESKITRYVSPYISFWGSTTPEGFRGSITEKNLNNGLIPRTLCVYQKHTVKRRKRITKRSDFSRVKSFVDSIGAIKKKLIDDGIKNVYGNKYDLTNIPFENDMVWEYFTDYEYITNTRVCSESLRAISNRKNMIALKLALIMAVASGSSYITMDIAKWATTNLDNAWLNIEGFMDDEISSNVVESENKKFLKIFSEHKKISRSQLYNKTKWLLKQKRESFLSDLIANDIVGMVNEKSDESQKPTTFYYLKSEFTLS